MLNYHFAKALWCSGQSCEALDLETAVRIRAGLLLLIKLFLKLIFQNHSEFLLSVYSMHFL